MGAQTDAYTVLLPAIDDLTLTEPLARFLDEGGRSFLIGETRAEYLARAMSPARGGAETADDIRALTAQITRRAGPALIAVDQEPAGICRLHGLVPQLPDQQGLQDMSSAEIEAGAFRMASAARTLGVTMFLSPVIDVITGRNPWLLGRTLGADTAQIARISEAFIRGIEAAGLVATPKHFPGHHDIDGDPAIEIATVSGDAAALEPGLLPFRRAIAANARAMMTGPALVPALDAEMPSSLSKKTIGMLRQDLGFDGLVVSDDLDAIGILRGQRDVPTAAVEALRAGSDLLLLSGANDLAQVRASILAAIAVGHLSQTRLAEAAARVRALADSMA